MNGDGRQCPLRMITQGLACLENQIATIERYAFCERAADREAILFGVLDADDVAIARKDHQHIEQMIAIVTTPCNMQCEIDLGRCQTRHRMCGPGIRGRFGCRRKGHFWLRTGNSAFPAKV